MFEMAVRKKLRFESPKGLLTVEDLWDLPLTSQTGKANLDDIAKATNRKLRESGDEVSFVNPTKGTNTDDSLRMDILKYIIGVRMAERDEAKKRAENKELKQRLYSKIAQKEDEALDGLSIDELKKKAAEIGG